MAGDKKSIGPKAEKPSEAPQEKTVEPVKDTLLVPEQPVLNKIKPIATDATLADKSTRKG